MKNDEWKMFYIHYRALYPDPLPAGEGNQHRLKSVPLLRPNQIFINRAQIVINRSD
jgi:hypothetical protein